MNPHGTEGSRLTVLLRFWVLVAGGTPARSRFAWDERIANGGNRYVGAYASRVTKRPYKTRYNSGRITNDRSRTLRPGLSLRPASGFMPTAELFAVRGVPDGTAVMANGSRTWRYPAGSAPADLGQRCPRRRHGSRSPEVVSSAEAALLAAGGGRHARQERAAPRSWG